MGRYTLLLICFLTINCGEALDTVGDAEPGPTTVPVEVQTPESGADFVINSATIENAVLSVVGSGTLPNGALISYEVKHDGFDNGDYDGYGTGQIEFSRGSFTFEMSVNDWPTGHALIRLTFEMRPSGAQQPAAVLGAYGENGEKLVGPKVKDFGGRKTITVSGEAEIS